MRHSPRSSAPATAAAGRSSLPVPRAHPHKHTPFLPLTSTNREEREQRRQDVEHLAATLVGKVNECVGALDEVEYLVATAGRYDLMFEVIVESEHHLLELMSTLRARKDVVEVEAFPCLKLYKQTFAWGA